MITLTFPDGRSREYPEGTKASELLSELGGRIAREAIAAKLDAEVLDLSRPLTRSGRILFLTADSPEGMDVFWHSAAHIMAHAVKQLYPEAQFAFGPPVEEGFYYDIDVKESFTPEHLQRIEAKMAEIVAADHPFIREEMDKEEALRLFRERKEGYKLQQIERLGEPPSIYRDGDFIDLCRGPHLPSTGYVRYFKLMSVAGAYWLGDEKNPMLQRIYGVAYPKKSQLDDYLLRIEEAKKRDHRRLGRELDLYSVNDEIGPGLILWHPKGGFIRYKVEEFWRQEHLKNG